MGTFTTLSRPSPAPSTLVAPPPVPSTDTPPVVAPSPLPPSPPSPPPDLPDDIWSLLLSRPDLTDADVAAVAATCRRLAAAASAESVWHARWATRVAGTYAAAPPSAVRGVPGKGGGWRRLAAAAAVASRGKAELVREREGLADVLGRLGAASADAAAATAAGVPTAAAVAPTPLPLAEGGGDREAGGSGRGGGAGLVFLAVYGGLLLVGVTGTRQVTAVSAIDGKTYWSVALPAGVADVRASFFVVDDLHWALAGAGPPDAAAACLAVHVYDLDGRAVGGGGGGVPAEASTLSVPLPTGTTLLPAWASPLHTAPAAVTAVFPTARPRSFVVGVAPPALSLDDMPEGFVPPAGGGGRVLSHLVVFGVPPLLASGPSSPSSPHHHPPPPSSPPPPPNVIPVEPAMAPVAAWRLARAVSPVSGGLAFVGTVVRSSGAPFGSPAHAGGDAYDVRGLGHGELLCRFAVPPGTGLVDVVVGGGDAGVWGWRSVAFAEDDAPMRLHVRRRVLHGRAESVSRAAGVSAAGDALGEAAAPVGTPEEDSIGAPPRSPSPSQADASVLLRDAYPSPFAADLELRGADGFFFHRPHEPPVVALPPLSWGAAAAAVPPPAPPSAAAATATCMAAGIAPALLGRFFGIHAGRGGGGVGGGGGGPPPTGSIRSFLPSAGDAFGRHSRLVYARLGGGALSWANLTLQGGTLLLGSAASGVLAAFGMAAPTVATSSPADSAPVPVPVGICLGDLRYLNSVEVPAPGRDDQPAGTPTDPRSMNVGVPRFVGLSVVPGGIAAMLNSPPWALVWRFVKKAAP